MVLQDLSPILPDPLVQNSGQVSLHKAILQCVSDLARRVGDSLHLLEALGGIVGKLLGPTPLTTAVLECVAAAAVAVNFFPAKVGWSCVHASHKCFPSWPAWLVLHCIGLLCAAWWCLPTWSALCIRLTQLLHVALCFSASTLRVIMETVRIN